MSDIENAPTRLCQIAMSVTDLRRTHQWYLDVLGMTPGGGTEMFRGWLTEKVQGVPGAATTCWWLVDQQEFFQLELFEFHRPKTRPLPADWRPCDIGYTTIGIHVSDFDAVRARATAWGTPPLTDPIGEPGARRVCVRDPEGTLIELMEDDPRCPRQRARPRSRTPAAVRFITASVPDLDASRRFFVEGLGLSEPEGLVLHGPQHEELWGLEGARRRSTVLWADDVLVELVQYTDPIGRPWPAGYSISDQGLLNIAFGFRSRRALDAALARAQRAGATPNWRVLELGNWGVVYVNDPQGFSVELLYVRRWWDRPMGFVPADPDILVDQSVTIDAPSDEVWQRVSDHASMGEWWPDSVFELSVEGEQRNGPGAVRLVRSGRRVLDEQVVAWEPGRRLDYRLRRGAPIQYHYGRVELTERGERGERTELRWRIRFCPLIPGTGPVLRLVIGRMLRKGLANLRTLLARPHREQRAAAQ